MAYQQMSHDNDDLHSTTRRCGQPGYGRRVDLHGGRCCGVDCAGSAREHRIGHAPRDRSTRRDLGLGSTVHRSVSLVDAKLTSARSARQGPVRRRLHSCSRLLHRSAEHVTRAWRFTLPLFLALASCATARGVCPEVPGETDAAHPISALLLEVDGGVIAAGSEGRREVLGHFGVNQIADLHTIDRVTHWLRSIKDGPNVVGAHSRASGTVWIVPSDGAKWKHVCWVAELVRWHDLLPQLGEAAVEAPRLVTGAIGGVGIDPIAEGILAIPSVALGRSIELRLQAGGVLAPDHVEVFLTIAEIDEDFGDNITEYLSFARRRVELSEDAIATEVRRAVCSRPGVNVHVIVEHTVAGVSTWSSVRPILVGSERATGRVPLIANTPYPLPRGYFVEGEWRKWVPGGGPAAPRGDQEPNVRR